MAEPTQDEQWHAEALRLYPPFDADWRATDNTEFRTLIATMGAQRQRGLDAVGAAEASRLGMQDGARFFEEAERQIDSLGTENDIQQVWLASPESQRDIDHMARGEIWALKEGGFYTPEEMRVLEPYYSTTYLSPEADALDQQEPLSAADTHNWDRLEQAFDENQLRIAAGEPSEEELVRMRMQESPEARHDREIAWYEPPSRPAYGIIIDTSAPSGEDFQALLDRLDRLEAAMEPMSEEHEHEMGY